MKDSEINVKMDTVKKEIVELKKQTSSQSGKKLATKVDELETLRGQLSFTGRLARWGKQKIQSAKGTNDYAPRVPVVQLRPGHRTWDYQ
jgi:hypothetical protein